MFYHALIYGLKKIKLNLFWKIILFIINFMTFLYASIQKSIFGFIYVLVITTFCNVLYIILKEKNEEKEMSLMRSLGSSLDFILLSHLLEFSIIYLGAVFIYAPIMFMTNSHKGLVFSLMMIEWILSSTFLTAVCYTQIKKIENIQRSI